MTESNHCQAECRLHGLFLVLTIKYCHFFFSCLKTKVLYLTSPGVSFYCNVHIIRLIFPIFHNKTTVFRKYKCTNAAPRPLTAWPLICCTAAAKTRPQEAKENVYKRRILDCLVCYKVINRKACIQSLVVVK